MKTDKNFDELLTLNSIYTLLRCVEEVINEGCVYLGEKSEAFMREVGNQIDEYEYKIQDLAESLTESASNDGEEEEVKE